MKVRCCALIISNQSLLTLKYHYPRGTVYALPGGTQEPGETLDDALRRELTEELGVTIDTGRILMVGDSPANTFIPQTIHIVFEATIAGGTPVVNSEHTSAIEAVWLPLSSMNSRTLYPAINQLVNKFTHDPQMSAVYEYNCMQRTWS